MPQDQNAVYLQSGDPDKENTPTLHAPGLLGARFTIMHPVSRASGAPAPRSKRYQLVRVDPAQATAILAGAPAYWVDKANYVVSTLNTNLNALAGLFNGVIAPGSYGCIQLQGPAYPKLVTADAAAAVAGDGVVGSATVLKANRVASGTAPPTRALGIVAAPKTLLTGDADRVLTDLNVVETS